MWNIYRNVSYITSRNSILGSLGFWCGSDYWCDAALLNCVKLIRDCILVHLERIRRVVLRSELAFTVASSVSCAGAATSGLGGAQICTLRLHGSYLGLPVRGMLRQGSAVHEFVRSAFTVASSPSLRGIFYIRGRLCTNFVRFAFFCSWLCRPLRGCLSVQLFRLRTPWRCGAYLAKHIAIFSANIYFQHTYETTSCDVWA